MIEHIHDLIVHYGRAEAIAAEAAYEPNAGSTDDARQDAHEAFVLLEQAIEELEAQQPFCFTDFVKRKMDHSRATWPSQTLFGVLAHARKEVEEIEDNISDCIEWVDLILLGIDGACRTGLTPEQLGIQLERKLAINLQRAWPKPSTPDSPGEHDRQVAS